MTFTYRDPTNPDDTATNVIKGPHGDKCLITMVRPGNLTLDCAFAPPGAWESGACPGKITMDCAFTPEAIALLTDARYYEQARRQVFTDDPAFYEKVGRKIDEECEVR